MTNVPVRADPNTRYVSQTAGNDVGNTCANASIPCRTIQHAIDVAQPDDEIRVAGGTYSNTGSVAVITKPMSLVGGYDPNFTSSDPEQYPTTLDALGAGSVISIASVSDVPWLTEDLDGKPRPQGGKWDMGAFGGTQASVPATRAARPPVNSHFQQKRHRNFKSPNRPRWDVVP